MKSFSDYCEFRDAQESLFEQLLSSDDEPSISSDVEDPNKLLSMAEKLKWIAIHGPESIRKKILDVLSLKFSEFGAGLNYGQAREELIRRNKEKRKKATDLARKSIKPYHR